MSAHKAGLFQLMQWKSAIGLEAKGIKITRRSVRTHACKVLGLRPRTPHAEVQKVLEDVIAQAKAKGAGLTTIITFEVDIEPAA